MSVRAQAAGTSAPTVPFVDLGPATRTVRAALVADIERLFDEGTFVNGPYVERFESAFAMACGREHCVGVASGLDALRLALIASGMEPGDEVVVPALTFIATFEAVAQAGGVPVPVDVCEDDAGMDVQAVDAALGPRTRYMMPVDLYGQPADLVALTELAGRRDLVLIEDACQAHGASRDGIRAGTAGLAAAFSFYPSKNLAAMGDAGAMVTDDLALAARVRALRQHGETRRYHSEYLGFTARLDALQALVLLHKLPHLEAWNADRARVAGLYSEALTGVGDLRLPVEVPGAAHVWHVYVVRTSDPEALATFLAGRRIATGRHYPQPPHLSPALASLGFTVGAFPIAEAISRECLSLPIFPGISEEQVDAVVDGVRRFFKDRRR